MLQIVPESPFNVKSGIKLKHSPLRIELQVNVPSIADDLCEPSLILPAPECIKSYHRNYGENFEHNIPENGSQLEFSPRGAPPEAMPVVLWNRTDPETSNAGRGRLLRGGKVWVAERVTQADQGNYTMRDDTGKVVSRSTLTVHGEQRRKTRVLRS